MRTGVCRSCGAPILWLVTERGKAMPVDVEPRPDGTISRDGDRAIVRGRGEAGEDPRYVSHFVTCPAAAAFRRRP